MLEESTKLTGSATDSDVPSSATINVMTASIARASQTRAPGLNSGALVSSWIDKGISKPSPFSPSNDVGGETDTPEELVGSAAIFVFYREEKLLYDGVITSIT